MLLLLACTSADADRPAGTDDTAEADTDTDTDADTDTDTTTAPLRGDTNYVGPDRIAVVVAASADPASRASLLVLDPADGTAVTVATDLAFDTRADCAGDLVLALESTSGGTDRVLAYDPELATLAEWSLGPNWRPQDVLWDGSRYWVAPWGKPRLVVLNADGSQADALGLDAEADADGLPEPVGLVDVGGRGFVVLARIDQASGARNGARLVELDLTNVATVNTIELAGDSPSGRMAGALDTLVVDHPSTSTDGVPNHDGGVEVVDLAGKATLGLVVDHAAGGLSESVGFVDAPASTAWLAFSDGSPQIGAWGMPGGFAAQRFPAANAVVDLGVLDRDLWVGENPFAGGEGQIARRSTTDGTALATYPAGGWIRDLAVCATRDDEPADSGG